MSFELNPMRQMGIVKPEKLAALVITLIGAGGIGSSAGVALTKMGVQNLTVVDDDMVEDHNIPNQMLPAVDLGLPKVESLAGLCEMMSGYRPKTIVGRYDKGHDFKGIVVSGVDSMESRAAIWEGVRMNPYITHYIDARMGGQVGLIYTICPTSRKQVKAYEKTLHSDEEGHQAPCTERAIIYNTLCLGGLISNQVKKIAMEEELSSEIILDMVSLQIVSGQLV